MIKIFYLLWKHLGFMYSAGYLLPYINPMNYRVYFAGQDVPSWIVTCYPQDGYEICKRPSITFANPVIVRKYLGGISIRPIAFGTQSIRLKDGENYAIKFHKDTFLVTKPIFSILMESNK